MKKIQEYEESYCGAYCLYMIYIIDRRFTIEGALDILINQVKCPDGYKQSQCLGCKAEGKLEVNGNVNDNANDNVNDNVNDKQGACFADANDKDDNDKFISIFSEQTPSVVYHRTPSVFYQQTRQILVVLEHANWTKSLVPQPNKEINLVHNVANQGGTPLHQ